MVFSFTDLDLLSIFSYVPIHLEKLTSSKILYCKGHFKFDIAMRRTSTNTVHGV